MHIEVSTDNSIHGSETFISVIQGLIQESLANLEEHITRVEVHLSDTSASTTGQEEKNCLLEARIKGQQPTVVNHSAATLEQATKGAASKMKSALQSIIGKLSDHH